MGIYQERALHAWTKDSIRIINTPSDFAKSALFYVQEVGHFFTHSSYFTEREHLDSTLIVYTVSGKGTLHYASKTYTLLPGQLFFIDCKLYQYYATEMEQNWEILWVHLNGVSVRAYYEQFTDRANPVHICSQDSTIPSIIHELIQLHRVKSVRHEIMASQRIVELLTELVLSDSVFESEDKDIPLYITEILQLIENRYFEKITLDALSKQFAVNKYHLIKIFKKYIGFSPGDFIINTRITKAKELLKYSDHTILEISHLIGIDNVSHFINLFKDRTGLTPLSFRKSWQVPK
ncbi:helix-turn-helix domain-containing protein [Paenibacillus glycanilyticus]|nr:AraC family transcriptional regulator [Paenibacillus glycanilyticus]